MAEDILIVEYEPRYTDRVRQALAAQSLTPIFAKDGEEALRLISQTNFKLVVLSSVIPKIATPELIRQIRGRQPYQATPILITVSGYNGKSPTGDAVRLGATDILPKPYSETEFVGKVRQLLGIKSEPVPMSPDVSREFVVAGASIAGGPEGAAARKAKQASDLDALLDQTLSGLRTPKKREADKPPEPAPSAASPRPKQNSTDIDKLLHDTLSGLEKRPRTDAAAAPQAASPAPGVERLTAPIPIPPQAAGPSQVARQPERPTPAPQKPPAPHEDNLPVSHPVILPKAEAEKEEEGPEGRFGQYVLLEKVATGGMAEVWKARMRGVEGFQKIVAIKKILPHLSDNEEFITMFVDEAKLAAQLNHNNIIHIYDLGKIASSYYIAMEYIDGHDLKTILKLATEKGHPISVEVALFVASKIAAALDYAHRKRDFDEKDLGLVHRDVSPQNVLISHEGDIKLCDFGIAKAASKASHTQAGALKGKLQYMSPEQAWARPIDRRSDIFALGAVLFEMLTARKLFGGDSEISILERVREARVTPPSEINDEVTPEIDRILLKALEKDAENRYQTAGDFARDLDSVLYSFRPTPTSADLAIFMHRLQSTDDFPAASHHPVEPREPVETVKLAKLAIPGEAFELEIPPAPEPPPLPPPKPAAPLAIAQTPVPAAAAPVAHEPFRDLASEQRKKPPIAMIAAGIGALLIAGGAVWFMTKGKSDAPSTVASRGAVSPASTNNAAANPGTLTTGEASTIVEAGQVPPVTGTSPNDDQLINAEVQKRLAAEKARLEQQRLGQQQAQTPSTSRPGTPQQVAPATQTVASSPVPPPAQETIAETRPEPPPPAAVVQVARAKEGDLVPAGTPGLTAPELVTFRKPLYPPMAKMRRVEGIVVLSALISETGKVISVSVLRGVGQKVGLDEAAADAVRNSTFRPGTKDGVKVRTYKTVTVPFKL